LVKPYEKDKIETRLLMKYEKNPENFDFKNSLKKVLLGENIWWIPSSWLLLENENWETLSKSQKENIYKQLIQENPENKNNSKQTEKPLEMKKITENIPESAEIIAKETTDNISNILENPEENNKWWIIWVEEKMQSNLSIEPEKLKERLSNKEKNISEWKEIFFTKDKISEYSQNTKSENNNTEQLKDLWENLIEWEKIVDEDLKNILWNFLIDTWEQTIEEYSLENPEDINEALNNAFELQIEKIKDWKVNYRTETVNNLKKEILNDDLTNPLEKIKKFKELKTEINTNIWSIAKKREKNTTWTEKVKLELEKEKIELQKEYAKLNKNPKQNKEQLKKIVERAKNINKLLKNKTKSWDAKIASWNKKIETLWNIEKSTWL